MQNNVIQLFKALFFTYYLVYFIAHALFHSVWAIAVSISFYLHSHCKVLLIAVKYIYILNYAWRLSSGFLFCTHEKSVCEKLNFQ